MSVRVQLDRPHAHFTNLDLISGRVVLSLSSDEAVSSIVVKLEGESKTRLAGPRAIHHERQNSKKTELEVHKILYNVKELFPSEEIKKQTSSNAGYTLGPGQHEYPFKFKLPFNNNCSNTNSLLSNLNFSGVRMEFARDTDQHVKKTLPPSLSGFPGEAEIRYYVKVTAVRPRFYQENHRAHSNFTFLPIEPPRPPQTNEETYARRQHQFPAIELSSRKKKGLLSTFRNSPASADQSDQPSFGVDVRLPNPPIITCNEPLPVRILVQKLSPCSEALYLQMLQIELISFTKVRAHELRRTECGSWVILSLSNMRVQLGTSADEVGTEVVVDNAYWKDKPLPNTVAPSFETCNISRHYELEVRVGLAYGSPTTLRPDFIILPLRHPVRIYSGIAPPAALLAAMAQRQNPTSKLSVQTGQQPGRSDWQTETPATPSYSSTPPQPGEHGPQTSLGLGTDAAPPSYEDAMAEDIGPVDGRRRDYSMPNEPPGSRADEQKTPDGLRRDSERLFPDSQLHEAPSDAGSGRSSSVG